MKRRTSSSYAVAALAGLLACALVAPGAATSTRTGASTLQFSGTGARSLHPFRLTTDSTLMWTNSGNSFGTAPRTRTFYGAVFSRTHRGTSYLPRGRYLLNVVARGNWRMTIRPGVEPVARLHGAIIFRGNGRKALPPFRVQKDSLMHWESSGGLFQAINFTSSAGAVQDKLRSGNSYLPKGTYRYFVNATSNWTLRIR